MENAKAKKTENWTLKDLNDVLKYIKKGKSRDLKGLSREIFHPAVIGENLMMSFLIIFNKLKEEGLIPSFMKRAIISP
jgi:hypothetical protein